MKPQEEINQLLRRIESTEKYINNLTSEEWITSQVNIQRRNILRCQNIIEEIKYKNGMPS